VCYKHGARGPSQSGAAGGIGADGATLRLIFLRFVFGLFFRLHLFSTTWPGLFLALFFPQERIFNTFPALFSGLFGFVFQWLSLFISNFPALFFKITSFFVPFIQKSAAARQHKGYHASQLKSRKFCRPAQGPVRNLA
jgi:Zn-dependent protease with chaperone function